MMTPAEPASEEIVLLSEMNSELLRADEIVEAQETESKGDSKCKP